MDTPLVPQELAAAWSGFCREQLGPGALTALLAGPDLAADELELAARGRLDAGERERLARITSPTRRAEWITGRVRRRELERALGAGACFSISHAEGWGIAVGARAAGLLAVGVDLERGTRPVSKGVLERLRHRSDEAPEAEGIALWTVKEAAYKADPDNEGQVLSGYRVLAWASRDGTGSILAPSGRKMPFLSLRRPGWQLAFAVALG